MDLVLHDHDHAGASVLVIAGEVDMATSPRLRERIIRLATGGSRAVVLDLSGVTMLDSMGLGVLVGAVARMDALGGRLALVCPGEGRVRALLDHTRLSEVLPLAADLDAAVAQVGAGRG